MTRFPQQRRARDAQSFDQLAGWYGRFAELTGREVHAWLSFRLPARAGRAVDLGCGTGVHTRLLATRFTEVLAVDISEPMLQQARAARQRSNVRYERRDLIDVSPDEDGRFDTVLSTFTLHHLHDLETALKHLGCLVRPGGRLLVVDNVDDDVHRPRSALRTGAWRACGSDLLHRRRHVAEAVELLRLRLNRDWLDHQASDQLHPPAEWERLATQVFPDAAITQLEQACGLHWPAPTSL